MDPERETGEDGLRRQIEALKAEAVEGAAAAQRARPEMTAWWEDLPADEFVVYRHQLRPVLLAGVVAMDQIFAREADGGTP
jgi:hypothetical protein